MEGNIVVTYKILCESDLNTSIKLQELLLNEKISKAIKSEFAKGLRNIELVTEDKDATLIVETAKELYSFEVLKDDFADILVLAEENAISRKLFKKDCSRVELVDIETII
jgi:fructose-1,6-bisphosphatase/inositol monophosphatase family enzyme